MSDDSISYRRSIVTDSLSPAVFKTVEDTAKGSLAEVTGDSCTVESLGIVPLDRASDDYHKLEFIDPVVEVKPEDLQEIKQEPADENDSGDPTDSITPDFIAPVFEVKPLDVKQEPTDEYETEAPCFIIQVSSAYLIFAILHVSLIL